MVREASQWRSTEAISSKVKPLRILRHPSDDRLDFAKEPIPEFLSTDTVVIRQRHPQIPPDKAMKDDTHRLPA